LIVPSLENTEGTIKDGQYRETGNTGYTRQRQINVREYRRDNQRWTVQRNLQHRVPRQRQINKTTTQYKYNIMKGKVLTLSQIEMKYYFVLLQKS
jgi:hypothetical protein